MKQLLKEIKNCIVCEKHLELGAKPVLSASENSKIAIIGQAPGTRVHKSGIPWGDPSGNQLRKWLDVSNNQFYDPDIFAIVPMGFCYPGKGKSGDLAPRKECAPLWHKAIFDKTAKLKLTLLIGQYAQAYYLGNAKKRTLTETVRNFEEYLPNTLVLPHPSPRNRFWLKRNPWFEKDIVPILQMSVKELLNK